MFWKLKKSVYCMQIIQKNLDNIFQYISRSLNSEINILFCKLYLFISFLFLYLYTAKILFYMHIFFLSFYFSANILLHNQKKEKIKEIEIFSNFTLKHVLLEYFFLWFVLNVLMTFYSIFKFFVQFISLMKNNYLKSIYP